MARVKAGFKSGDMVTVKESAFRVNWDDSVEDTVNGEYHCTAEDTERWYADKREASKKAAARGEDTFHIHMNDAGESRLPPLGGYAPLHRGTAYRVLRARCRTSFSYYNATGGWTKLLDLNSGREVYYKMEALEKVVA